jgi:hypothetical protein
MFLFPTYIISMSFVQMISVGLFVSQCSQIIVKNIWQNFGFMCLFRPVVSVLIGFTLPGTQ